MESIRTAIVVGVGVLAALWWAATPPHSGPRVAGNIASQRQLQCPGNTELDGKLCACPVGTAWSGSQCIQVWSSAEKAQAGATQAASRPESGIAFARDRVPSLPPELGSWKEKIKAINSHDPRPGSVAMIEIPSGPYKDFGHIAIVESVTGDSMTIIEGDYAMGTIVRRTASGKNLDEVARQLNIVGYFKPASSADSAPGAAP